MKRKLTSLKFKKKIKYHVFIYDPKVNPLNNKRFIISV